MTHLYHHTSHPSQPLFASGGQRQKQTLLSLVWMISILVAVVIGCLVP